MGLFLAMSGVAKSNRAAVEEALRAYAAEKGGKLEATGPTADVSEALLIAESGGNVTVMYPGDFVQWDDASQYLSKTLKTSVFSLHIHDEDLWMYVLYSKGKQVDQFNPIPDYWEEEVSEDDRRAWSGNAAVVGKYWPCLVPESIGNYLFDWDLDDDEAGKAYPDDEFAFNDCWQITDFMRRLGLVYPVDDNGKASGATYHFVVPDQE